MTEQEIFEMVSSILVSEFEIDSDDIAPEVHLYQDLDIDSIDAVDLLVKLRAETGKSIEADDFKQVATIQDLVNTISEIMKK